MELTIIWLKFWGKKKSKFPPKWMDAFHSPLWIQYISVKHKEWFTRYIIKLSSWWLELFNISCCCSIANLYYEHHTSLHCDSCPVAEWPDKWKKHLTKFRKFTLMRILCMFNVWKYNWKQGVLPSRVKLMDTQKVPRAYYILIWQW